MNNSIRASILASAAAAATSKTGAYGVPASMNPFVLPMIHEGLLGLARGPLNAPGLWVFITAAGRAAL